MFVAISLLLLILHAGLYSGGQFGVFKKGSTPKLGNEPPEELTKNKEHELVLVQRLHHLNMLIFKDVIVKVRLADKLQEKYKGTLSYELGIITAGILDHFKEMLSTYYTFTDKTWWTTKQNSTEVLFNAYHSIHGRYMQILQEKDMYTKILQDYLRKQREARELYEKMQLAKQKKKYDEHIAKQKKNRTLRTGKDSSGPVKDSLRFGKDSLRLGQEKNVQSPSDKEYKRLLRMKKWAKKWNNFDPKIEGIDIEVNIDVDAVKDAIKKKKI